MTNIDPDHLVYADLNQLVRMRIHARQSLTEPQQVMRSILSGRNKSRLRGRGLSFEELRAYRVGDDIRTLDWKATNRTGKPHVRVYSEERERDVLVLVDQRTHMFFGSKAQTKSVTAADVAALAIWRALALQDRVGALIFNDESITKIKPQRSHKAVMQILHSIVQANHQLKVTKGARNREQFNTVLSQAERLCTHDSTLILISDLDGWDQNSSDYIRRLRAHNDLVVLFVVDPLEQALPKHRQLVISDGDLQISLDTQKHDFSKKHDADAYERLASLRIELSGFGVSVGVIDTSTPAHQQHFETGHNELVDIDEGE